jgi:uncharacterized protein (TIGR03663 family)
MKSWLTWSLLIVFAVALALRLPGLSERPMHTDESVHAYKFLGLWETGKYQYDPKEYHGPSLYYLSLPAAWLSGAKNRDQLTEASLRITPAIHGAALILALLLLAKTIGAGPVLAAGLLTAVSPALVFYSRYFIHEIPLVLFTFLALAAGWRHLQKPAWQWAVLLGVGLGLMQATKETFVFNLAAAAGAILGCLAWQRFVLRQPPDLRPCLQPGHWALVVFSALAVSLVLFSSFFTNARGPLDSLLTYEPWFKRAGGQTQHLHPWHYYLSLLFYTHRAKGMVFSEAGILLLAAVGAVFAFLPKATGPAQPWFRFVALYSVLLTAVYSVIPYKTPWCLVGFLHGFILLAGYGASRLYEFLPSRIPRLAGLLAFGALCGHLGWQAWQAGSPTYCTDRRNPYVYAHTTPDLLNLVQRVNNLAAVHPRGKDMVVKVIAQAGDYWPLPWYLRSLNKTGFFYEIPEDCQAEAIIASPKFGSQLESKLAGGYIMTQFYGHRPAVFLCLYVRKDLWEDYLKKRAPEDD